MVLRIFKMIFTSGLLTALEMYTESFFGRGSSLDPTGGAYRSPSWLKGPYF